MVRVAFEEQDEQIMSIPDHAIEMKPSTKFKGSQGGERMKAVRKRYQLKVKSSNYWSALSKPNVGINQLKEAIQEETTEETLVKIQEFVHKKCRYMRKYFQQSNQLNDCRCRHNEDIVKLYKTKDYQKIDSQVYSIRRRNVCSEVQSSYQEKVVIKRRILNDYMNIINRRQVIVQDIQENLRSILEMHQDLLQYYNTYYSKRNNKQFYRLQSMLLPEFRYILKFISNKGRQFETRIKNFVDPSSSQQVVAKKQEDSSQFNSRSTKGTGLKKSQSAIILVKALSSKEDEQDSDSQDKSTKISALQQKLIQQKTRFQNLAKVKGYFFLENTEESNQAEFNNANNSAAGTKKYASFETQKYGSDKMKLKIFQNDMKKIISHEKDKASVQANSKHPATALNSPNKATTGKALNKTQSWQQQQSKSATNKMETKSKTNTSKSNQNNQSEQFFMSRRNPKFNQLSATTSPKSQEKQQKRSSLRQSVNVSPGQANQLSSSKENKIKNEALLSTFQAMKQDPVQFTDKKQLKSIIPGKQENQQVGGTRLSTRFGVKSNKSDTMQYSSHTRIKSMGSFTQIIGMKEFANFSTQPLPHQGVTQFRRFKEKYFQQSDSKEDDVKPRFQQLSIKDLRTNSNPSLPLTIKELKNSLLNSNNYNTNTLSPYLGQYGSWGATTLIPESEDEQTPKESSLRHHSFLRVPGINTTFRSEEESAEDTFINQDATQNMKRSYFAAPKTNTTNSPREKQSSVVSDLAKEDVFIYKKLNRIYLEKIYDERILNRKSFRNINPPHSPDQIKALIKKNSTARIFPQPSISNNLIPSSDTNKLFHSNNISSSSNVSGINLGITVNGTHASQNQLRECKSQPFIPNILRHFSKEEIHLFENPILATKSDLFVIQEKQNSPTKQEYKKTNSFEKDLVPSSSLVLTVPNVGPPLSSENFTSIKEIIKPGILEIPPSLSLDTNPASQPNKLAIFQLNKKSMLSLSSSSSSDASSSLNSQRENTKPLENTQHQQRQNSFPTKKIFKKQSNSPQNESLSTNASFPSPSIQSQVQYPCIKDPIIQEQALNKNDNNIFSLKFDKQADLSTALFQENHDKNSSKKTKKITLPLSISPRSKKHITPVSMSPREVAANAFSCQIDKLGEKVTSQKLEITKLSEQIENNQRSQEKLFSNIKRKFNTCLNKQEKGFRQYMKEIDMPFEEQIRILNNEKNQMMMNESSSNNNNNNSIKQWNQYDRQQPEKKQQSPQSLPPKTHHSQNSVRFHSSNKTNENSNISHLGKIPQNIEELLIKTKKFKQQRTITQEQSVSLTLKLSEFESRLYHKNISSFFPKNK